MQKVPYDYFLRHMPESPQDDDRLLKFFDDNRSVLTAEGKGI